MFGLRILVSNPPFTGHAELKQGVMPDVITSVTVPDSMLGPELRAIDAQLGPEHDHKRPGIGLNRRPAAELASFLHSARFSKPHSRVAQEQYRNSCARECTSPTNVSTSKPSIDLRAQHRSNHS
eukprot:360108-Chlamydomonas_euryale.AAC.2